MCWLFPSPSLHHTGGHSTFFGLLNTFVHIVMYTYYMFSAMGPQFQKYLWWKKYLTTLQMVKYQFTSTNIHTNKIRVQRTLICFCSRLIQVQFVLIMVHAFQLLFIDCNYPKAFVWWIGMHAVMFFFLFNEFYKNAYKGRRTVSERLKACYYYYWHYCNDSY